MSATEFGLSRLSGASYAGIEDRLARPRRVAISPAAVREEPGRERAEAVNQPAFAPEGVFEGKEERKSNDLTCNAASPATQQHETTSAGGAAAGRGALNPTRFLNRAQVRRFLLESARAQRAHKWTRVSEETLVKINEIVRSACLGHVRSAPSKGKTL